MKATFFAGLVLACLWAGAGVAAPVCQTTSPAANIQLVKGFYAAFVHHDKGQLGAVLADDWIDVPLAPGQGPGLAGMKAATDEYYKSFPDFTPTNADFIAQGDKVVVRSMITATQAGPFASVPASGKKLTLMAIDIHKVCNGKIVQTWHVEDWLSGLYQMGALPLRPAK